MDVENDLKKKIFIEYRVTVGSYTENSNMNLKSKRNTKKIVFFC